MNLSEQELDAINILQNASNPRDAGKKIRVYFGGDTDMMSNCIRSLGAKGFLVYQDYNSQGQQETATIITDIDQIKCKRYATSPQ